MLQNGLVVESGWMFEEYEVKTEKVNMLDALRRVPNLTLMRFGLDFAAIEFSGNSLFSYRAPEAYLIGRCGLVLNDDISKSWYISIYDAESERKVAEALSITRGYGVSDTIVASIHQFQLCEWKIESERLSCKDLNGHELGSRVLRADKSEIYADLRIASDIESPAKEYLLVMLALFQRPLPWYKLGSQTGIETTVDF